jgi:dTDP-4-amino-4,6-dideoxygalactose transaminase
MTPRTETPETKPAAAPTSASGAAPKMIPIALPFLGAEEGRAAQAAVESGWVSQGPKVAEFERLFAAACGTSHAVAVSNCTTALHLAFHALGIGPGDEVICPSMSFIATANAIRHTGATPVFADVDPRTFNLDPAATAAAITPRTKAILPVHQIGLPADMDAFVELGRKHKLHIVEDAACAIGSRYHDQPIGGHGEMACFSLHPRKVITTGEGGMITTNSPELADRLRLLRQHAMSVSDTVRHAAKQVVIEQYTEVGFNYRMTDIQAAVGIVQLGRLTEIVQRRRALAARYDRALAAHPFLSPPYVPADVLHNYQSYATTLADGAPITRDALMQLLLDRNIATRRGVMLSHLEPAYRDQSLRHPLPCSEQASNQSLLLPLYPSLSEADQDRVVAELFAAFGVSAP